MSSHSSEWASTLAAHGGGQTAIPDLNVSPPSPVPAPEEATVAKEESEEALRKARPRLTPAEVVRTA